MVITIDGRAWLGKTTLGKELAARLNYEFLSTGDIIRWIAKEELRLVSQGMTTELARRKSLSALWTQPLIDMHRETLQTAEIEMHCGIVIRDEYVRKSVDALIARFVGDRTIVVEGRRTFDIVTNRRVSFIFDSPFERRASLVASVRGVDLATARSYLMQRDALDIQSEPPKDIVQFDSLADSVPEAVDRLLKEVV